MLDLILSDSNNIAQFFSKTINNLSAKPNTTCLSHSSILLDLRHRSSIYIEKPNLTRGRIRLERMQNKFLNLIFIIYNTIISTQNKP